MGPFRGPYRGSPLRDPCWWAVTTEVAAHWEEVLMGPFRGGTHKEEGLTLNRKLITCPIGLFRVKEYPFYPAVGNKWFPLKGFPIQ